MLEGKAAVFNLDGEGVRRRWIGGANREPPAEIAKLPAGLDRRLLTVE